MAVVVTMCKLMLALGVGFYMYKSGVFSKEINAKLSTLIARITNPALLIFSVSTVAGADVRAVLRLFIGGCVFYAALILFSFVYVRVFRVRAGLRGTYMCMLMFANYGFMGYPVIIAAMGENVLLCGENRDRGSLRLPGEQEAFVEKLIATGKPVVLVVFGGRAQVISGLAEKCAAVIQAWYPGEEGGNALADIIYGKVSPSGKLCVSYPSVELREPVCYDYSAQADPRIAWPFGYGLSYTTFEYSGLSMDTAARTSSKAIKVAFDVTNSGETDSDEIVQLYVSPASEEQDYQPIRLQGFGRVSLKAGETKHVEFLMSPQQFGHYDNGQWTIDSGDFIIKVGASSADIRLQSTLSLKGKSVTMPLRTVYFSEMQ